MTRTSTTHGVESHRRRPTTRFRVLVAALVSLTALSAMAHAQPPDVDDATHPADTDQRWVPWLGCWQLVEETGALPAPLGNGRSFADRVLVCVTPSTADDTAVVVTSIADGEPVLVETLRADGIQHATEETECGGWRRTTWSGDGARLFTQAELACSDNDARQVSGVGLMTGAATWLDIELVRAGGRGAVTVRRYRRASGATIAAVGGASLPAELRARALSAAQLVSTSELGVDDVVEAGDALEPAVVEAMLVETGTAFALDSRALIRLDDAGVAAEVIDLMVALSFPDEFVVDRPVAQAASSYSGGGFGDAFGGYGYDAWYPYYASPFGYYYGWSPYNSLYYWGPAASYAILPNSLGKRAGSAGGRAFEGRGYTQVGVREPSAGRRAKARSTGGARSASSGSTESKGGRSTGSSSGSSGGGGRATPGGYSRGGSSGRSAVPRDR